MIGITRPLRAGKTRKVMEMFLADPCAKLLVMSDLERLRLIKDYSVSFSKSKDIITWDRAVEKTKGIRCSIYIDNVDCLLASILGREVKVVTFTGGTA